MQTPYKPRAPPSTSDRSTSPPTSPSSSIYNSSSPVSPYSMASSASPFHYNNACDSPVSPYSTGSNSSYGKYSPSSHSAYEGDVERNSRIMSDEETEERMWERRALSGNSKTLEMFEEQALSEDEARARRSLIDKKKDVKRERSANLRALSLVDQLAAGEQQRTLSNDGGMEVKYLKHNSETIREREAKSKALYLLAKTVNADKKREAKEKKHLVEKYSCIEDDNEYDSEVDIIDKLRSDSDIHRERAAHNRALKLLHDTAAFDQPKTMDGAKQGFDVVTAGIAARVVQSQAKEKPRPDEHRNGRPAPKLVHIRPECLAETTRQKHKAVTAEDILDPETVAGMKCKLHWDREKEAQDKALKLLKKGYVHIA